MPLLRPSADKPATPDVLSPAERAVYDMTYTGRGDYTNLLAGFLVEITDTHRACWLLKKKLWDNKLPENQKVLWRLLLAQLTEDRNRLIDKFFSQWTPAAMKEALDNELKEPDDQG